MLGKTDGKRRRGQQRMRWLDSTTDSVDMNRSKLRDIVKDRGATCCSPWDCRKSDTTERLNDGNAGIRPPGRLLRHRGVAVS